MEEALKLLRQQTRPVIAVVGSVSRTFYEDFDTIAATLEILNEVSPLFVRGSYWGFDYHLGWMAAAIGLELITVEPVKQEGRQLRRHEMVQDADLLLVFPAAVYGKKKHQALDTADPSIVEVGMRLGLPILGIYRDAVVWRT